MGNFVSPKAIRGAFSTNQQTSYGTALPDTSITIAHPYEGNKIEKPLDKWNNKSMAGKGHEFATYVKNKGISTNGSLTFDSSSFILGWALAFLNGSCVSSQPDSTTAYRHTIKMMDINDPSIGKQLPSFSYVEQLATGVQTKFRDMVIKSITITGKTKEQLKVSVEMLGSGFFETSTITMPAPGPASFLIFADVQLLWGASNISAELKSFSFKHTNELNEKDGYFPGSGRLNSNKDAPQIRGRCLVSSRSVELSWKMAMKTDSTIEADSLTNEVKAVTFTAEGDLIEDTYKHGLSLSFPQVVIKEVKTSEEDGMTCYDCSTELKWDDTLGAPYEAIITNITQSYLDLPA